MLATVPTMSMRNVEAVILYFDIQCGASLYFDIQCGASLQRRVVTNSAMVFVYKLNTRNGTSCFDELTLSVL